MNVVLISPNFPPQFYLFAQALRDEGAKVLGMGDCPPHELRPEVSGALNDYAWAPQQRYEDFLGALRYLNHKHGKIHRIDSLNEHWLQWEARLRDDFNIEGPRADQIAYFRSKSGMRSIFRSAGVPSTSGERVESADQVRSFANAHGFPLVFKPDVGVGAAGAFKVSSAEDLEAVLVNPLVGYVVEQFCHGELTSFDGLTDKDGQIVFSTSHVYSSGVMEMVNEARDVSYYSRRDIPPLLEALGRKVVAAFEVRERFFHIEFFEEPSGFRALEINIRPPGGYTTDIMNYACDIDIYKLWSKVILGRSVKDWTFERKYHAAHISRRYGRKYQVPHHELLEKMGDALMVFREIPPILSGAMGNLMYLVRYPDLPPLKKAVAWAHEPAAAISQGASGS